MVNLGRVPEDGRIFESIGEDPVVGAAYARAVITGIQNGTGVMATVKHWVNNNQETNRTLYSATVNRRAQVELYFPAYVAAIEAGVGAVMCRCALRCKIDCRVRSRSVTQLQSHR